MIMINFCGTIKIGIIEISHKTERYEDKKSQIAIETPRESENV